MKPHVHRSSVKPTLPPIDQLIGTANGLFVKQATIDPEVGDEMIILIRDRAPIIDMLIGLQPLMLNIRGGVDRNVLGQVAWILFSISEPDSCDAPAFSTYHCFDPHSNRDTEFWQQVADQNHLHLFMIVGDKLRDFYTFENLGFDTQFNYIMEKRFPEGGNAVEAERLFRKERSCNDLLTRADGHHRHILEISKRDLSDERLVDTILGRNQPGKS